jgi:ABC-2 type transport system ATP-binding protein
VEFLSRVTGTARIGGHDIVRDMEPIKEMIGYMSQQFSLYDELTVNENLIFSANFTACTARTESATR